MKCRWKNCPCESRDGATVLIGKSYYHEQCAEDKHNIDEMLKLWQDNIESEPIWNNLRRIINDIIYTKKHSSSFLLFAIKYCINNKINLKHPPGLYYIIKDEKIVKAYNRQYGLKVNTKINLTNESKMNSEIKLNTSHKTKSVSDLFD